MMCPPNHSHSNYCYVSHKCRCEKCRADRAQVARNWYHKMSAEDRKIYNKRRRAYSNERVVKDYKFEPWQIAVAERVARERVARND